MFGIVLILSTIVPNMGSKYVLLFANLSGAATIGSGF